MWRGYN